MKIGVFSKSIPSTQGGGSTFLESVLSGLNGLRSPHELVLFSYDREVLSLKSGNWRPVLVDDHRPLLPRIRRKISIVLHRPYHNDSPLNRACRAEGIDLVYFPGYAFEHVDAPYVYTVWDLQHRLRPYFPEVTENGQWQYREGCRDVIVRSSFVITGTERGRQEISIIYGVHPDRIRVFPLPTPEFPESDSVNGAGDDVLRRNNLEPGYVFYPAQFWAHKNHYALLAALRLLGAKGEMMRAVFTGSDHGNLERVRAHARELGVADRVTILGFVPRAELVSLYRHALCLAYPSFFGPDNLPPLEAMSLGCPVVDSDIPGAREQCGDAALYFDPRRSDELAARILQIKEDAELRRRLIACGRERAKKFTAADYTRALSDLFDEFSFYQRCWS
jgi:glycosyltransferase involved in cell wall biosynthesis